MRRSNGSRDTELRRAHRRRSVIGALAVLATMAACSDPEDQSLCTVYAEFQEAARAVDEIDIEQTSAGEALDVADNSIAVIRHLQGASDGRYSDAIEQLETSVEDVRRVLASVEADADSSIWQPLVEDSVEEAREDAARVDELIEPSCQPTPNP